eukprot:scaffold311743_cov14-Tisochrysis_lutea.AAC.1
MYPRRNRPLHAPLRQVAIARLRDVLPELSAAKADVGLDGGVGTGGGESSVVMAATVIGGEA